MTQSQDPRPVAADLTSSTLAGIEEALAEMVKPNGPDWTLPWKVEGSAGKPLIYGAHSGLLFRGSIATWQEARLIAALVNNAPALLSAARHRISRQEASGEVQEEDLEAAFYEALGSVIDKIESTSESFAYIKTSAWTEFRKSAVVRSALSAQPLADAGDLERLRDIIERDRSTVAEHLSTITKAISARDWMREGRGSYAYDDDRYQAEFGAALDEIWAAVDGLRKVAGDWADCSRNPADIKRARALPSTSPDELRAEGDDLEHLLRSDPSYLDDPVEQLAFELAWELEEADLKPGDLVTINREKLRAIAQRILKRALARPDRMAEMEGLEEAGNEAYREGYLNGFTDARHPEGLDGDERDMWKQIDSTAVTDGWQNYSDTFRAALSGSE